MKIETFYPPLNPIDYKVNWVGLLEIVFYHSFKSKNRNFYNIYSVFKGLKYGVSIPKRVNYLITCNIKPW